MITALQKLEIIISVIILGIMMLMIESGLTLTFYSVTKDLLLTEISIVVEVIATCFVLYLYHKNTHKSFINMNNKNVI